MSKLTAGSTLAAAVEFGLRRDILAGDLRPGDKLRVEVVCDRYGAGASPAREALSRLSAEGLVERRDQRGFYVGQANLEDLRELVATRCQVETLALRLTMRGLDAAWEEQMVLTLHRLSRERGEATGARTAAWETLHDTYHDLLIAGAGARLRRFCQSLRAQANRYRLLSLSADPLRPDIDEHRAIAEAAIDGDEARAVGSLVAHYEQTLRAIETSGWFAA